MTLARQMYRQNTEQFTNTFEKATKHPYGFLFVDLKPFTLDQERLKCNVMWPDSQGENNAGQEKCHWFKPSDHVTTQNDIKERESRGSHYASMPALP